MNFKRFSAGLLSLIIAGSLCTAALADNDTDDISISNLTLDNVKIDIKDSTAITHVGVLAGTTYLPSIYKNITVTNSEINVEKTVYDDEKKSASVMRFDKRFLLTHMIVMFKVT